MEPIAVHSQNIYCDIRIQLKECTLKCPVIRSEEWLSDVPNGGERHPNSLTRNTTMNLKAASPALQLDARSRHTIVQHKYSN
jgi:hypothetical protein